MSLLTLLSLDNDDIECVTSAVRIWCDQHGAEVDSRAVTKAMSIAPPLLAGETSPDFLADTLTRHPQGKAPI